MTVLKKPEKKLLFYHQYYGLSLQCTPSHKLQSIEFFFIILLAVM